MSAQLAPWQKDFIQLALRVQALSFGEFKLKSGRISPYFFNAGRFFTGATLSELGRCYAATIAERKIDCDFLFGPAYKGIPLVAATSVELYRHYQIDLPYCFNRKEIKDHGEGGLFVGAPRTGKALVIDDVITAGTAVREVAEMLKGEGVTGIAVLIGLDRQERGQESSMSATQELQKTGIQVFSIVSMSDLRQYIADELEDNDLLKRMDDYRETYGVDL
jgi:orotate phosphoribosyltransferase